MGSGGLFNINKSDPGASGRQLSPYEMMMQMNAAMAQSRLGQMLGQNPQPYYGNFTAPLSTFENAGLAKMLTSTMGAPSISPYAGGEVPNQAPQFTPPIRQPVQQGPQAPPIQNPVQTKKPGGGY